LGGGQHPDGPAHPIGDNRLMIAPPFSPSRKGGPPSQEPWPPDDSDRFAAARGIMTGTALGIFAWAAILWVLKGQLSDVLGY
jgi:hypothetical protein